MIFLVDPPCPRTVESMRNGIDPCNISKHGIVKREVVINFPSTVIEGEECIQLEDLLQNSILFGAGSGLVVCLTVLE